MYLTAQQQPEKQLQRGATAAKVFKLWLLKYECRSMNVQPLYSYSQFSKFQSFGRKGYWSLVLSSDIHIFFWI